MKIIYIGQLDQGGTCFDRMQSIKRLGHEVFPFDTSTYQSKNKLLRSMQWRLKPEILLIKLNQDFLEYAQGRNGLDLVWVDKGIWIFPETITALKRLASKIVHYTPDSQLIINKSCHFENSISEYDLLVTTKSFEVEKYKSHGAKNVLYVTQSIDMNRYLNAKKSDLYQSDIGFISDYKPHYGKVISSIDKSGLEVNVWGPKWKRASLFGAVSKNIVRGNGLWGGAYVDALASFKIGLGLLSKYIPEQHTTRTFEIPAAGSFLLAERTVEHQTLFLEGVEAEYFSEIDELIDKSMYYLANDHARNKIAQAGHERLISSGYDNDTVMANIFKALT